VGVGVGGGGAAVDAGGARGPHSYEDGPRAYCAD